VTCEQGGVDIDPRFGGLNASFISGLIYQNLAFKILGLGRRQTSLGCYARNGDSYLMEVAQLTESTGS